MDQWKHNTILRQYHHAIKQNNENLVFYMDPANVSNVYVLMRNIAGADDEYVDGEYLVKIMIPTNYPFVPPVFHFLTPQGKCDINVPVCIDIGHYHSNNYRPNMGLYGFTMMLYNFLITSDIGNGIGILNTTVAAKKEYASKSKAYNMANYENLIANMTN